MTADDVTLDATGRPLAVGDDVALDVPTAYLDGRSGRVAALGYGRSGEWALVDVAGLIDPLRLPGYQTRKVTT